MARHEHRFIISDENGAIKARLQALAEEIMKFSGAGDYSNSRLESFSPVYGTKEYTADSFTIVFSHIPKDENTGE